MTELILAQYCPCGCVAYTDKPEHIERDKKRREQGYLDALILPSEECPTCLSYHQIQKERDAGY